MEKFINTKETLELLRVSRSQLYRMIGQGRVKAYKPMGRLLFNYDEVMTFIGSGRVMPKPGTGRRAPGKKRRQAGCAKLTSEDYKKQFALLLK